MTAVRDLWNSRKLFPEYKDPDSACWMEVSLQVPFPPLFIQANNPGLWDDSGNCNYSKTWNFPPAVHT